MKRCIVIAQVDCTRFNFLPYLSSGMLEFWLVKLNALSFDPETYSMLSTFEDLGPIAALWTACGKNRNGLVIVGWFQRWA